mgnify:CR=1 FL=1
MKRIGISDLALLLVEPSPTQHRIISGHLSSLGVTDIEWEQTGSKALTRVAVVRPDVVISAMHLPDMTGTELLHELRNGDMHSDTPFMLISSETDIRYLAPIRQAGVTAILPKPYQLEQLKRALFTAVDYLEPDTSDLEELAVEQCRVLIVDDSITSRHHVRRLLSRLGVKQFCETTNGKEAIAALEREYFDLVVTDYNMPEMDGRELTEYIRQHSSQSGVPILMITSEQDSSRLAAVQQTGVSAICDKPFEPDTIKHVLKTTLSGSS